MKTIFRFFALVLGLSLIAIGNVQAASQVTFYHHDALGSIIAESHENGYIQLNEEYQPYGEKIYQAEDTNGGNEDWYTGKNYSKELDLTYFGARWYDAKQGRFLSMDPVGVDLDDPHTFNRYAYVGNNPYTFIDSDGRSRSFNTSAGAVRVDGKTVGALKAGYSQGPRSTPYGPASPLSKLLQRSNLKSDVPKSTHGNKLDGKPAEGYTLRDRRSGEIKKYGETTRGEDKFGAGKQKRYTKKYLKENDLSYVKETSGTKKDMHQWQHQKILDHKAANNGNRPQLNKSDY